MNMQQQTQERANLETVAQAVDMVWNRGDFSQLKALVNDNVVIHMAQGDIRGQEGLQQFHIALRNAFPDMHFTVEEQFAHDDKVVIRWRARGTHHNAFQGIPPTRKQVEITGMEIARFTDSRLVECWPMFDELGMMQQLGVVPMPNAETR